MQVPAPIPPPAVVVFTATQIIIALVIGIATIAGIAYRLGGVAQSQKDAESNMTTMVAGLTTALQDGLAGVIKRLDEAEAYQHSTDILRENWQGWRVGVDRTLGEHTTDLSSLKNHLPRST
jgi:hypothetical protein